MPWTLNSLFVSTFRAGILGAGGKPTWVPGKSPSLLIACLAIEERIPRGIGPQERRGWKSGKVSCDFRQPPRAHTCPQPPGDQSLGTGGFSWSSNHSVRGIFSRPTCYRWGHGSSGRRSHSPMTTQLDWAELRNLPGSPASDTAFSPPDLLYPESPRRNVGRDVEAGPLGW